ncbi:MAG: TlyA family RNA methyltransferase [Firmicutes bacterium]|nr:TlyA family RNA methyltransferase [Bacillota bacterium]
MMKTRLDLLLMEKGMFNSREKARAAIITGKVLVNQKKVEKPGTPVREDAEITVIDDRPAYVSRGGYKLEKALRAFGLELDNLVVLDVGCSTGGFTDCALKHGAQRVLAVDVGYGQMAWELRQDPRVRLLERTNIRYLTREDLGEAADLAVIDVSFISLELVLPPVRELLRDGGRVMALIKPQFEAGREKVGKRGVVREPGTHRDVIRKVIAKAGKTGFTVMGLSFSPIRGPEGNIEYLLLLEKTAPDGDADERTEAVEDMIETVVAQAHRELSSE